MRLTPCTRSRARCCPRWGCSRSRDRASATGTWRWASVFPTTSARRTTIEVGSMLGSDDFKPQAIVSAAPGGCDINAKIHEFVSHYLDIPQFILEKPVDDTERGREQYSKNYRQARSRPRGVRRRGADRGEAAPGRARRSTSANGALLELWDLHKAVPCPVPNLFSLFTYAVRFTMWGTDEAIGTLQTMVDVSKKRLEERAYPAEKEVARCLLDLHQLLLRRARLLQLDGGERLHVPGRRARPLLPAITRHHRAGRPCSRGWRSRHGTCP